MINIVIIYQWLYVSINYTIDHTTGVETLNYLYNTIILPTKLLQVNKYVSHTIHTLHLITQ